MPEIPIEGDLAETAPLARGIFDCDNAYRTPTRSDYEDLFSTGIIALDTNVLINLYRSNERTRKDTLAVLSRLRDRLWIPHQVLTEFWRNRDNPSIRGHHHSKAKEVSGALDKIARSTKDALDRWLREVHLSSNRQVTQHVDTARKSLEQSLAALKEFIQEQAERDALEGTDSTHTDPVLIELDVLLRGRVGDPFSKVELDKETVEAQRRANENIPPGYEDFRTKPPERAAGDYILWAQVLNEAERRRCDVLLVTGDVKEDWWVPGTGYGPARPRSELCTELRRRAGVELFMLTPSQLLARADEIFGLKVDERSVSDLATTEQGAVHAFPEELRQAVPVWLHRGHLRARAAFEAAGSREIYGHSVNEAVRDEFITGIESMGGITHTLKGRGFPVYDGHLVYPMRYARKPAPPEMAARQLDRFRGRSLLDRESTLRTDLENLNPSLRLTVVAYTSDESHGIHSIHLGIPTIDPTQGTVWEYIEELPTLPE
ncbi:PIN-like domain-containing protein [Streptomyces sp. NPDC088762]|uniref:PIN-like domain-containing protein n=1 Tax=Streptomyces sp. NPDC088762 TaxID=3365891 RepID=UPI0038157DFB